MYQIKITNEGETAISMISDEDGFEHAQSTGNMVSPDAETLLRKKTFIVFLNYNGHVSLKTCSFGESLAQRNCLGKIVLCWLA